VEHSLQRSVDQLREATSTANAALRAENARLGALAAELQEEVHALYMFPCVFLCISPATCGATSGPPQVDHSQYPGKIVIVSVIPVNDLAPPKP